jgi:hypothetical protein
MYWATFWPTFSKTHLVILGVAEKHDFRGIQQKIPQFSNFAKNWDSNPLPHGDVADNIAKMFAKKFSKI